MCHAGGWLVESIDTIDISVKQNIYRHVAAAGGWFSAQAHACMCAAPPCCEPLPRYGSQQEGRLHWQAAGGWGMQLLRGMCEDSLVLLLVCDTRLSSAWGVWLASCLVLLQRGDKEPLTEAMKEVNWSMCTLLDACHSDP